MPCSSHVDSLSHLITDRDVEAYLDGELHGRRRIAVERYLACRRDRLGRAAGQLRLAQELRAMREAIYEDRELKTEVDRLLRRHRRRRGMVSGPAQS